MFNRNAILALAVSGAILAGCDTKKEPAAPPAPTPTVSNPAPVVPTPPPAPVVPAPTTDAPAITPPVVPSVTPVTPPPAPATPTPPSTPTPPAPSATTDVNADAKATLAQFGKDMLAKDWKAAGDDLKKLNDQKDKLTPELQDAVKKAQTELDAAKATSGLKIPGLGGGDSNK